MVKRSGWGSASPRSGGAGFLRSAATAWSRAWVEGSGTNVSGALTYQITDRIFAGVEGRWLTAFSGAFLNDQSGWGLFAGPTLLIKMTESAALNLVWTPQLTGSAAGRDGHLDLDNFERHQFRAKFAASF